jgi:hypothetical protein
MRMMTADALRPTSRYFLSRHAFACETGRHVVFLDLKHGMYSVVEPEDVTVLRERVRGWPTEWVDRRAADRVDDDEVIEMLVREGLLTANAALGKDASLPRLETPTDTFLTPRVWPNIDRRDVRNFVAAWARTTLTLRVVPISWLVRRARLRKAREAAGAPESDPARVRQLTSIHMALQPLFYDAKDACLRNSLTLIEFLSRYRIYPTWAFGVRVGPFAAHSWVQHGSILLTDPVDHVKTFTPIMVI